VCSCLCSSSEASWTLAVIFFVSSTCLTTHLIPETFEAVMNGTSYTLQTIQECEPSFQIRI
jgi:hypothetical protein